jgi:hypothetical protein
MSTGPAERLEVSGRRRRPQVRHVRRRLPAVAVAAVLVVVAVGGCSDDVAPRSAPAPDPSGDAGRASGVEVPPDLGRAFSGLLDRRAAALLAGDRASFGRGLVATDDRFRAQQATYFDNLTQLPVAELRFDLDPGSLVRSGDDYWGVVEVYLRLEGFDQRAAVTVDRYRFSPLGDAGRRFGLSSVTDPGWERRHEVSTQPWDDGPIEVRSGVGVLGIFDAESVHQAGRLVRSVERGIGDVAAIVPYEWSRSVVVYALSDTEFLASIEDPPGGHPERLDGVAFPVEAAPSGSAPTGSGIASTRFVLHPRMLDRPQPERDRLIRHELTHVAIGEHDDNAPVWLSEGLAEYVSVRPLAPEDRRISDAALAAAKGGLVTDLPEDATFNDGDSAVNYGVAWWATEYLAVTLGAPSLWTILDELDAAGVAGAPSVDDRLEGMTGLNTRTLARRAAKLMIATFDPDYQRSSTPSSGPSSGPPVEPSSRPSPDAETSGRPEETGE